MMLLPCAVPIIMQPSLRGITPEEIGGYDFCPADEEILARLRLAGKTAAE